MFFNLTRARRSNKTEEIPLQYFLNQTQFDLKNLADLLTPGMFAVCFNLLHPVIHETCVDLQ